MKHDRLAARTNEPFLRVKRVAISGLFRLYDHDVPLHTAERVTILHGPNGVGKTALLRLIAVVFAGDYTEIIKVPFKKLDIELSDDSVLTFKQTEKPDADKRMHLGLSVSLKAGGKPLHTDVITFGSQQQRDMLLRLVARNPPLLARLGPDLWIDHSVGEVMSTADAYSWYFENDTFGRRRRNPAAVDEPNWFAELRSRVQVHLIETQRLLRMTSLDTDRLSPARSTALVPTVRDYARDLHTRITDALAQYATQSQALDQSFPQRLVKAGGHSGLTTSDLKARMSDLDAKRAKLQQIGLLDSATVSPFDVASLDALDPAQSNVMSLYVEDTQKKLAVLDDLSRRITILLGNVNAKFRNKSIQIHCDRGFVVIGSDGAPLDPDSLSSGEQHELVLLYDLLFRVRPGTLVLIDEPELSLHVGWQKRFLPDLLEIVKTAEFDALLATHSPFIVGDRSDLMVPLAADIDA